MNAAVALVNPKYPHNVGAALCACAAFEAKELVWTGDRVPDPKEWPRKARLPREERIKAYQSVRIQQNSDSNASLHLLRISGYIPVCVEVQASIELPDFIHPPKAVYVFGPEDGDVPKGIRHACHRFVTIPTVGLLNLAATVNLVLYDRMVKERP